LQGVRWDILSYNSISGITAIKNALANGPVIASFDVYTDFDAFFNIPANNTSVYHYDGTSAWRGGHSIVIVSYDETNQYWLCKNSWGSNWADGGYFRIGFGQCGIESWDNYYVSINQSCYAKISPNLISSLTTALNYSYANNEYAYVYSGTNTLTGSVNPIPSTNTLLIKSGATVNLNGYSIISTSGTITKESSATITGLRAYLKSGSIIKGYCGSINFACNNAAANNLVDIQSGTFSENITFTGRNSLTIAGQGMSQTTISGKLDIYSSTSLYLRDFTCQQVSISSCVNPAMHINLVSTGFLWGLHAYNSSGSFTGSIRNANYGYQAVLSTHNIYCYDNYSNTCINNNTIAVYASNSSNISLYRNAATLQLCGNANYEYSVNNSAQITATMCSYPSGANYPRIYYGNSGTVTINGKNTCSGLSKTTYNEDITNQDVNQNDDPVSKEFKDVNKNYSDLINRIYAEVATNGFSAKANYRKDCMTVIDGFKSFIKKNPESVLSGTSLTTIVHSFKQLDDFETMKTYLQEIIGNTQLKKNRGIHGLAKRFMMDYYCQQKDFDNAIKTADEILRDKTSSDSSLISDVLYAKGLIYAHDMNKPLEAVGYFSSIIDSYPDNPMASLAQNEMGLLGYKVEKKKEETAEVVNNTDSGINNYPNPFNPTTVIRYKLPTASQVSLKVYDMLGREVATLLYGMKQAGSYSATFDGEKLASGVYIIRLVASSEEGKSFVQTKKMILTK
jgi:tetratricopeptide (TPR) repeat protein